MTSSTASNGNDQGRGQWRVSRPVTWLAAGVLGVVLALEAIEEIADGWHKARGAAAGWWRQVEHRERRRLLDAELDYVLRRLPSR